ncbi:gamma-glutamylcyclotransferase [Microcystis aeruginosa]|uniref:gamma-glutamylcyclotransferase n=1 Tax=Microcystis aeruginosa TaxID=1126 RepID=UPI0020A29379|nr:gamma-glutamylcyclotransferase [Microcystis aeruginosa]
MLKKVFRGGRVWGVGCRVWGFTDFEVVSYLIFREKVQGFYPRSLALFEVKKSKSLIQQGF